MAAAAGEAETAVLQELCRHECNDGACAVTLRQLRSLQQPQGDQRCGYYALYNALALQDATGYSRQGFEDFVASCQAVLSSHAATQDAKDKYPWRRSDVQSGLLERLYLDVLIESIQTRHPGLRILSFLEASLSSLRNNHAPIEAAYELEHALDALQQASLAEAGLPQQLVVLVGSAIHWFVLNVRRTLTTNDNDTRQHWEIALIDSQNHITLLAPESDLRQIAESLSFSVWLQAGWQKPTLVDLAVDSFRGINCLIELLRRRVMQESDNLVWDVVRLSVEGFIESFPVADESSSDKHMLEQVLQWNREIFPTPVVRCNIISMLRTVIAQHTAKCMLATEVLRQMWTWCQQQQLWLSRLHRQQHELLEHAEPEAIEMLVALLAVFEEVQHECRLVHIAA